MMIMTSKMRSTAIAALLSLPLATGAAFAQGTTGTTGQTQPSTEQAQQPSSQSGSQSGSGQASSGQMPSGQDSDAVVATVGAAEILGSDVMTYIGALPPQLQSQPPQMLLPMALEQLILRELIIEEARRQNLADDPEVTALVGTSAEVAEEDAMVQVWLSRQMESVVTDEAVQKAYDDAKAQGQQDLPALEEVRPQIEQYLLQQEMRNIGMQLREGAEIVLFDATGQPVEQQQGGQAQEGQGTQGNSGTGSAGNASGGQSGSGTATGSTPGGQSTGGSTSGSSETTGTAAPKN